MKTIVFHTAFLVTLWLSAFGISAHAYETGHQTLTFTDPSRDDRQIPVEAFYPADESGEMVPVAAGDFPVVGFGHGFVIPWNDYPFLATALSSTGFIIAFVGTETGFSPDHADFGLDIAFCITGMRGLDDDPQSLFFEHVAPSACVMGHSMGGGAALLAASGGISIDAVVTLAAAETTPSAIQAAGNIAVPALFITGDQDCITPSGDHQLPMYGAMPSICKTVVDLTGASHCQFAGNSSLCRTAELFSGCSATIDESLQESRTLELILPWLNAILNQSSAFWIEFQNRLVAGTESGILDYQQDCDSPATPTPDPASTQTPVPSWTAAPTATSTSSPTPVPPSPTSVAPCPSLGVDLEIPSVFFRPGDPFHLVAYLCNPNEAELDATFFTILEVMGSFFFAPSWSSEIDFELLTIESGETSRIVIPEFLWPDSAGGFSGAVFWSAMTDSGMTALIGDYDRIEFEWGR